MISGRNGEVKLDGRHGRTFPAIDDRVKLLEFPERWRKVVLTFVIWFVDVEREERGCWWTTAGLFERALNPS